jgi:hypothetical protein
MTFGMTLVDFHLLLGLHDVIKTSSGTNLFYCCLWHLVTLFGWCVGGLSAIEYVLLSMKIYLVFSKPW